MISRSFGKRMGLDNLVVETREKILIQVVEYRTAWVFEILTNKRKSFSWTT
jgi:hypothetical protein